MHLFSREPGYQKISDPFFIKLLNEVMSVVPFGDLCNKEAMSGVDQAAAVDEQIVYNPIIIIDGMDLTMTNCGNF